MTYKTASLSAIALLVAAFATNSYADAAAVIMNEGCLFPTSEGTTFVQDAKIVATNSANGNRTFNCKVKGLVNESGKAIHANGNQLGIKGCVIAIAPAGPFCLTSNWNYLLSASGRASLTCHCKNEDNFYP